MPSKLLDSAKFVASFDGVSTLQQWGVAVENGVDSVLRDGHHEPWTSLPKSHRGRCQPVEFVRSPFNSPVKAACPGSFEPSSEIITVRTRRQVKQVRRLESLYRRISKWERQPEKPMKTWSVAT